MNTCALCVDQITMISGFMYETARGLSATALGSVQHVGAYPGGIACIRPRSGRGPEFSAVPGQRQIALKALPMTVTDQIESGPSPTSAGRNISKMV